jgi:O-succinylhomoserine sulfhydrylase
VRVALEPSQHGENSEALYLTSGFVQPDAETSARRFADPTEGYTYGRTSNPTVTSFERRLAALEGTEAAIGASTGMGAILMMCMGLLKAGDHVICSRSMFGSTIALIGREFGKFGVETTFVSQTDVAEWKAALRPTTKLLFAETPTNPLTEVCDIRALADLAHSVGALLAVDNCFCSPALQRPVEFGADLIIHSGTKYLDGQGRVMAGAICGPSKIHRRRVRAHRAHRRHDAGALQRLGRAQGAGNAEHPHAGPERQRAGRRAVAGNPARRGACVLPRPAVAPAARTGHAPAVGLGGAVLSFDVRGSTPEAARANAFQVINSTQVLSIATNLGDTKTIISHSATTSHGRLSEEQRQAAGIGQSLVRLAVGLDHVDDIKADLSRGLNSIA